MRVLDKIKEMFGICLHEWPQWSEPIAVPLDPAYPTIGGQKLVQSRRCSMCGEYQQRDCGLVPYAGQGGQKSMRSSS